VHLVGFIVRIYYDTRFSECQIFWCFFWACSDPTYDILYEFNVYTKTPRHDLWQTHRFNL